MSVEKFFTEGLVIGLSIAAAVGPIAMLCIHRTLARGFKIGFLTGLGAALADSLYGLMVGTGLATITHFLFDYKTSISCVGSLFLLWLGIKTFRTVPVDLKTDKPKKATLLHSFISSFLLTLSSPMTIVLFTAVFASFGLVGSASAYINAAYLVCGIFMGSTIWWLVLSGVVKLVRERLSFNMMRTINRASGVMLLCFASYMLITISSSFLFAPLPTLGA